jgi:aspartyl-tRNA(Asn)/glutamyl-tRNA(Gln) amidotransferase subunit C
VEAGAGFWYLCVARRSRTSIRRMAAAPITRETALHIARLARLALDDDEIDRATFDLDRILAYVAVLDEVDTTGVAPMADVFLDAAPLRDDVAAPGVATSDALAEAPRPLAGGFGVPGFVDE